MSNTFRDLASLAVLALSACGEASPRRAIDALTGDAQPAGSGNVTLAAGIGQSAVVGALGGRSLAWSWATYAVGDLSLATAASEGGSVGYYPLLMILSDVDLCPALTQGATIDRDFLLVTVETSATDNFHRGGQYPPTAGAYAAMARGTVPPSDAYIGTATAIYFPAGSQPVSAESAVSSSLPDGTQMRASAGSVGLTQTPNPVGPLDGVLNLSMHAFQVNTYHAIFSDQGAIGEVAGPVVASSCPAIMTLLSQLFSSD